MPLIKHIIEPRSQRGIPYILLRSKAKFIAARLTQFIDKHQKCFVLDAESRQQLFRYGLKPSDADIDLLIANSRCRWADETFNAAVARVIDYLARIVARVKRKFSRPQVVARANAPARLPPSSVLTNAAGKRFYRCPISRKLFADESAQIRHTQSIVDEQAAAGLMGNTPVALRQKYWQTRNPLAESALEISDFKGRTILLNRTVAVDLSTIETQATPAVGKVHFIEAADDGTLLATARMGSYVGSNGRLLGSRDVQLFSDQLSRRNDSGVAGFYDEPKQAEARETD
jgi:hypothetical protein